MFYQKKKKEYSEVSESKLNINSDYFNIFQYEFKKYFSNDKNDNKNYIGGENISNNNDDGETNNIDKSVNTIENIKENTMENTNILADNNNKTNITNNSKTMVNTSFKNVELEDNDIFFINLFTQYINKSNDR